MFAIHLSSDSSLYFKRAIQERIVIGWRVQYDFAEFTHVSLARINMKPSSNRRVCKIYCNLVTSTVTDPNGTLCSLGGLSFKDGKPGRS